MYLTINYVGHAESIEKSLTLDKHYPPILSIDLHFELFHKPLGFSLYLSPRKLRFNWANYVPF